MIELSSHCHVQDIALRVLRDVVPFIRQGNTEREVVDICTQLLKQYGAEDCWYYNVPALVLVGERTALSMSGRDYQPTDLVIRTSDLVTIDLSPMVNGCWGDCARSYIVESGIIVPSWKSPLFGHGVATQKKLHAMMMEIATPKASMHELYSVMNQSIENMGYRNLDFRGNLGHSIETHLDDRRFIEANNFAKLGECELFTFEPHICLTDDRWGFKLENIYYFEGGKAKPLGSPELLEAL
jgi:Xaa-Pro aminopeptidase